MMSAGQKKFMREENRDKWEEMDRNFSGNISLVNLAASLPIKYYSHSFLIEN